MSHSLTLRQPQHSPALYYSSVAAIVLEYACAIYFMLTLAQTLVQYVLTFLMAIVVSTFTITMWKTVADLIRKKRFILALFVCAGLNAPAFVYDVHGFLGVSSEINHALGLKTDVAIAEKELMTAQIDRIKSLSKINIDTAGLIKQNSTLTRENNRLSAQKTHCKNQWGKCAKDIDRQMKNNAELIASNNAAMQTAGNAIASGNASQQSVNAVIAGENDNRKTHEVFQALSYFFYKDIRHAKIIQGNVLTYFAIFLSLLVMTLPFLANILCFDMVYENVDESPAPLQTAVKKPAEEKPTSWHDNWTNADAAAPIVNAFSRTPHYSGINAYKVQTPIMQTQTKPVSLVKNVFQPENGFAAGHASSTVKPAESEKELDKNLYSGSGVFGFVPENAHSDRVQIDADAASIQAQTHTDAPAATGRNEASLKGLDELIDCVMSTDTLFKADGTISQNAVEEFMKVGRPRAKKFINALKEAKILTESGHRNTDANA